jgi:nucleotide-binding universal stress UspA family protein
MPGRKGAAGKRHTKEDAMSIKVLLAVDGSETSDRATDRLIALQRAGAPFEVTVIQVQPFMSIEAQAMHLQSYGEASMKSACARLDAASIRYQTHIAMGPAGVRISEFAEAGGFELVVLGTKGLGWVNTVLMGSVAKAVVELCSVPVVLVR